MNYSSICFLTAASLITLAFSQSIGQSVGSRSIFDYVIQHEKLHKNIRTALLALKVTRDATSDEIKGQILMASKSNSIHSHIYSELTLLESVEEDKCTWHLVLCCLSIMTQDELEPFRKIVEASRERINLCARKSEKKIEDLRKTNVKMASVLNSFDELLKLTIGVPNDVGDDEYLNELNLFSFSQGKLPTRKIYAMVRNQELYYASSKNHMHLSPVSSIEKFINDRCKPFQLVIRNWLDTINLDRVLGGRISTKETEKMNEFHRICADFDKNRPVIRRNLWLGVIRARR